MIGMSEEDVAEEIRASSAFLCRHESLHELHLSELRGRNNEDGVVPRILRLSGAACQRLQELLLDMCSDTNVAVGKAIQTCCPQLSHLSVHFFWVDATFFTPLRNCHNLTMLVMAATHKHEFQWPREAVQALAMLPSLLCIQLEGCLQGADLPLLAALTAVQELCLSDLVVSAADGDAAHLGRLLGGMTQLFRLDEPTWVTPSFERFEFLNTVAAQLGGLRRLTSLLIGETARYEDELVLLGDGFTALCQLPALTRLSCLGIGPQQNDSGGHLPLLQRLELFGDHSPHSLAASLRPLRPLPALRKYVATVCLARAPVEEEEEVEPPAGNWPGSDAMSAVASMRAAASLLAAAPQLQDIDLSLHCDPCFRYCQGTRLFVSGVAVELLTPLKGRLVTLRLRRLPAGCVEVLWPLLCRAPRLETLEVSGCSLSEEQLRWAGQAMPALRDLRVSGFSRGVVDCAEALAAARALPRCGGWSRWHAAERNGEVRAWRRRD